MNRSTSRTLTPLHRCAVCGGRIKRAALSYGGQSAGSAWIHIGRAALAAQTTNPHAAEKGTKVQMATTTARRAAASKPARTTKAAPVATKPARKVKAAPKPVRGAKSEAMREMFREGATVSEVAAEVGAHYSFAHGVASRMVEAGDLDAMPTAAREPKAAPAKAAKAKPAAKAAAKKNGRPTAARRAANRTAKPAPVEEDLDEEDQDLDDEEMDEEEYEEEE